MTIPTFPSLSGLSFPVKKTPVFNSLVHEAVSGVSTAQSLYPYALVKYDLPFDMLRSNSPYLELQQLLPFYKGRRGRALPFHFTDPDDYTVTAQSLGTGDNTTTDFGFVRADGAFVEPVQDARASGLLVYKNAVLQTLTTDYTILTTAEYATNYGVRFVIAPGAGVAVTATLTYDWLCRFDMDEQEFSNFMQSLWEVKSLKFKSVGQ